MDVERPSNGSRIVTVTAAWSHYSRNMFGLRCVRMLVACFRERGLSCSKSDGDLFDCMQRPILSLCRRRRRRRWMPICDVAKCSHVVFGSRLCFLFACVLLEVVRDGHVRYVLVHVVILGCLIVCLIVSLFVVVAVNWQPRTMGRWGGGGSVLRQFCMFVCALWLLARSRRNCLAEWVKIFVLIGMVLVEIGSSTTTREEDDPKFESERVLTLKRALTVVDHLFWCPTSV